MSAIGEQEKQADDKVDFRCAIGTAFSKRLECHILRLTRMGSRKVTKHSWIESAIKEKWEREKALHPEKVPAEKGLSLKLPKYLSNGINSIVEFIRKYRRSYSKKQWVVEAIEEQLERESQAIENWLKDSEVTLQD